MDFKSKLKLLRVEIIAILGVTLLRLISSTLRWKVLPPSLDLHLANDHTAKIFAFWHDQQLTVAPLYRLTGRARCAKGLCALASRHSDGRIIARIMEKLGFKTVLGSSSRGGSVAFMSLFAMLKDGYDIAITPDGPKGPRHHLKDGVVKLAQLTEAPVYPVAIGCERRWIFNSWDRMFLPKPFSKAVFVIGRPIYIPKGVDEDSFRRAAQTIEEGLREMNSQVNRHVYT